MALLVTEQEYLPALLELLDHAKTRVEVIAFSFAIGSAGGKLSLNGAPYQVAQKLIELKRRGVNVRVYLEGARDTSERNVVTARFLKKSGIKVKMGATHAKGFLVDGKYILFGSTNLTHQSIAKNNETNLVISNTKASEQFERYFEHLWNGGGHGGVHLDPPFLADGDFLPALIELADGAKERLEFSIYFFDQREIEEALIRAHKRGVQVRGFIHNHFAFAMPYVRRTRATVKRLSKAGLDDLHYGPTHLFTHSKYIVRDGRELMLGTGNWLNEDVEIHPQLYVKLNDKRLCSKLVKHLQSQIEDSGLLVSNFKSFGFGERRVT